MENNEYLNNLNGSNTMNEIYLKKHQESNQYDENYQKHPPYYNDLINNEIQLQNLNLNNDTQVVSELRHWSEVVYECVKTLNEWDLAGGSDYGQLTYFIDSGDIVLEIDGIKISGYTRNDVLSILKQQHHLIKAVSTSSSYGLSINLKEFLSRRFVRGSIDHDLQSTIRDNVYIRTIPCTTRYPKPNEIDGIDYKFVTKEEFLEMERNGLLLESGVYAGHHYGTPLPLSTSSLQKSFSQSKILNNENNKFEKIDNENETDNSTKTLDSKKIGNTSLESKKKNSISHPSALALKRKRNRSNIAAIDASSLPHGWERINDAHYGIYYIDHINKRTQYERPYEVELVKGNSGFGFTLVELDKGLVVVKTIIPGGAAASCGIIHPDDILVSVSGVSVSGLQHSDIAKLFSTFAIGDKVKLTFARGMHIPEELINNADQDNIESELMNIIICKGQNGFGFTVSDGFDGQKVKKILDIERCGPLREGDLLTAVNGIDLTNLEHIEVVEVLKNHCQVGENVNFIIKRPKNLSNKLLPNSQSKISLKENDIIDLQRNCKASDNDLYLKKDLDWNKNIEIYNLENDGNIRDNFKENISQSKLNLPIYGNQQSIYNYELSESERQSSEFAQNVNANLNKNLIAELKANLANHSNNSSMINLKNTSNTESIDIQAMNQIIMPNSYSNLENVNNEINSNNVYNVIENQNNYINNPIMNTLVNESTSIESNYGTNEDEFEYFRVSLNRGEKGFGFRIVGGRPENRNVTIGSIVIGGVAHVDGILKAGDEIISINDQNVMNASHHHVVSLLSQCETSVSLLVKRKKDSDAFDVILNRDINEGFGFVIISCGNCALIGRIIDNSPAQRCQRLKIRDKIIAINGKKITQMSHPDIVNMIKESGLSLKLRIIPADCYTVELIRGPKGFGFSIRGLQILRVAPDNLACSLLNVGDEIIEINSIPTVGITHAEAVLLISQSGAQVKLKLRRRDNLNTSTSMTNFNAINNESFGKHLKLKSKKKSNKNSFKASLENLNELIKKETRKSSILSNKSIESIDKDLIGLVDIPLNSETNSLNQDEKRRTSFKNETTRINKSIEDENLNKTESISKNRLSATFSTYDLKAQLNNSNITLPSNNKDQQIKLSKMFNKKSFKDKKPSPIINRNFIDENEVTKLPTILGQKTNTIRPFNDNIYQNDFVNKNNIQNKKLLTEANDALSSTSTMKNGIILTNINLKANNQLNKNQSSQPLIGQMNTRLIKNQTNSQTKTIVQASTSELLKCVGYYLLEKCSYNLPSLQWTDPVHWLRAVDCNLLSIGWQDIAFISPANLVFFYLLLKESIENKDFAINKLEDLQAIVLTCLYLSYSYMGNEISYPLKPFLIRNDTRAKFWKRSVSIINTMSDKMLKINADLSFFAETFSELKNCQYKKNLGFNNVLFNIMKQNTEHQLNETFKKRNLFNSVSNESDYYLKKINNNLINKKDQIRQRPMPIDCETNLIKTNFNNENFNRMNLNNSEEISNYYVSNSGSTGSISDNSL